MISGRPAETTHDRLISLDIIRGCAVLGILIVNIAGFALPFSALNNPTVAGVASKMDYDAWYLTDLLVTNSMRGLFAMLFGASIILLTRKIEQQQGRAVARSYFFRRNLFLLLLGLIHSYLLLMAGDVLFPYALTGFILYFLKDLRPRNLIFVFLLIITLKSFMAYISYISLNDFWQMAQTKGGIIATQWQALISGFSPSPQETVKEIAAMKGSYLDNLFNVAPFVLFLQSYYFITEFLWDVASMMLLGMALFKLRVLQGTYARKFYLLLAIAGYAVGIMLNANNLAYLESHHFDFLSQQKAHITADLARVGLTLGHLGLLHLFISLNLLKWLKEALAAVGRTALSNYIMQTEICIFLFYGFGFNLFNELGRADLLLIMGGIWIFQLVASVFWLKYFSYGPLEWLWRSLTLGKRIALKKTM